MPPDNQSQRILIVEDEDNARKGYEAHLRKWDCEVLGVASGEDALAKFPEFADVIRYLELFLKKEGITAQAEKSPALAQLRQTTLDDLHKLKSEGFPYGKTVDGVEKALAFFDVYERGKPDSNAAPDLYHAHRYQYYSHFLKAQTPDHVMFPTFYALGATDLLKTRGVPIGFLGVPPETS